MARFSGKTVLITGAASGFGRLLARQMAAEGAKLVLGDIDTAGLDHTANGLNNTLTQHCDVTQEDQVKALADLAVAHFGQLNIAVNNAGASPPMKPLIETTGADMDHAFAINAKGVLFGMKHQIPHMLQSGGVILNVASMAGIGGAPKLAAYAAAKHAVIGLTKTAALEHARHNIRVNAICPFYSPTPLVTETDLAGKQGFLAQGSPMKRLGTPQEMVAAMLAILDPANSYMTGQAIAVDGGVSAL